MAGDGTGGGCAFWLRASSRAPKAWTATTGTCFEAPLSKALGSALELQHLTAPMEIKKSIQLLREGGGEEEGGEGDEGHQKTNPTRPITELARPPAVARASSKYMMGVRSLTCVVVHSAGLQAA